MATKTNKRRYQARRFPAERQHTGIRLSPPELEELDQYALDDLIVNKVDEPVRSEALRRRNQFASLFQPAGWDPEAYPDDVHKAIRDKLAPEIARQYAEARQQAAAESADATDE
jgi:hypothetical protein